MSGVIDSRHWLRQRIGHLEELLRGDPPPDQRELIEAELDQVRAELHRTRRWRLWVFGGSSR